MKFIWNEPVKPHTPWYQGSTNSWEQAVRGWLNYMGVWPERGRDYWECDYNPLYHFFDIYIYECWLDGHGEPDRVIKAMRAYLQSTTLDWTEYPTFKWDNGKQRPGVRFWIQAEDFPNKRKFHE